MVDCGDLFSGSWVTFGAQISDEVGPFTLIYMFGEPDCLLRKIAMYNMYI